MNDKTDLSNKMLELADKDNLPDNHELRTSAIAFNESAEKYFIDKKYPTKKFLGNYARARRVWCEYTGENLI